jgi:hypothetical protein
VVQKTEECHQERRPEAQEEPTIRGGVQEREKAGYQTRLYLTFALDEKLEALKLEYKRRTGKKIKPNEIMRKLIEKATIEAIL